LPLFAPKGPLLLKLNDLCLTVEGDGDLGSAQATGADDSVVFQELAVLPFLFSRAPPVPKAATIGVKATFGSNRPDVGVATTARVF
jgi:hypothetical protein